MNIHVVVNCGKKPTLTLMLTVDSPADALAEGVKRAFGLEDYAWQHYYWDKPVHINHAELVAVLTRAAKSEDPELLKKRLGNGFRMERDEPIVTLFVQKATAQGPSKAATAAPKTAGDQETIPSVVVEALQSAVQKFGLRDENDQLLVPLSGQPPSLVSAILDPLLASTRGVSEANLRRKLSKLIGNERSKVKAAKTAPAAEAARRAYTAPFTEWSAVYAADVTAGLVPAALKAFMEAKVTAARAKLGAAAAAAGAGGTGRTGSVDPTAGSAREVRSGGTRTPQAARSGDVATSPRSRAPAAAAAAAQQPPPPPRPGPMRQPAQAEASANQLDDDPEDEEDEEDEQMAQALAAYDEARKRKAAATAANRADAAKGKRAATPPRPPAAKRGRGRGARSAGRT